MAYNGFIRFASDVLYEITEDGEDITVLRNGEPVGGGVDTMMLMVRFTYDPDLEKMVADKTYEEIKEAAEAYKIIQGVFYNPNTLTYLTYPDVKDDLDGFLFTHTHVDTTGDTPSYNVYVAKIDNENNITESYYYTDVTED